MLTNTRAFLEAREYFEKHGVYTKALKGTRAYYDYWDEQITKCKEGVTIGNITIPGEYYFYLNFTRMRVRNPLTGRKIEGFPLFTDVDLEYFNIFKRARDPNDRKGIILLKPRRTGFSYKNAGLATYEYNFYRDSVTCVGAYENKWSGPFIGAVMTNLNFLIEHTCWNKPRNPDQLSKDYCKAQHQVTEPDGRKVWKGYMSEIWRLTFKDNPGASAGKSTSLFFFEECFAKGTRVIMADNSIKNIEDIVVGDYVKGYNGLPKKVIKTTSGVDQMYKVTQQNGNSYVVNSNHKLVLEQRCFNKNYKDDGIKLYTPEQFLKLPTYKQKTTYGLKTTGLIFPHKNVKIDPYYLGIWLGDGSKNAPTIVVNLEKDLEIKDFIYVYANQLKLNVRENKCSNSDICKTYTILDQPNIQNKFFDLFKEYNLWKNKHIPDDYLYNSPTTRLELLAGLIDTDGNLNKKSKSNSYSYEITTIIPELKEGIIKLCKSLGFKVNVSIREPKTFAYKNKVINGKKAYRISISGKIDTIPCKIKRKIVPSNWNKKTPSNFTAIKVEKSNIDTYYGITLQQEGNGESDHLFLLEDYTIVHNCGQFDNILESFALTEPTWMDGNEMVGTPILFGTGGDMGKGAVAFSEMFYSPEKYGLMAFDNIWEDDKINQKCGWFLPASRQRFGVLKDEKRNLVLDNDNKPIKLVDDEGNSNELAGIEDVLNYRKFKKYDRISITEYPLKPSEGFLITSGNTFPTIALKEQLSLIRGNPEKYVYCNWVGDLEVNTETGEIEQRISPDRTPLRRYPIAKDDDIKGCLEIYEQPQKDSDGRIFSRRYIVSSDPYDDDAVVQSDSLGSILVFDRITRRIVAEYTGRRRASEFYEIFRKLIIYYNAYGLGFPEINKIGIVNYFENKNSLYMLAETPLSIRDKTEWKPGLNTSFGYKATKYTNDWGNELINDWLLEEIEPGSEIKNLHKLRSTGLLEELIKYHPDGNFDRISCLRGVLILDTSIRKQAVKKIEDKVKTFLDDEFFEEIGMFETKNDSQKSYIDPETKWDSLLT